MNEMTPTAQELRSAVNLFKKTIHDCSMSEANRARATLIASAQSVLSASDELPKRLPDVKSDYVLGVNETLDKVRPVVERLKMRVSELEELCAKQLIEIGNLKGELQSTKLGGKV